MRLSDSFMKLIAYTNYFLKNVNEGVYAYERVRPEVERLLEQSEGDVGAQSFSPADYDLARFALCAWIDEAILSSNWSEKGKWRKEPLQKTYYKVTNAGEAFFERLNSLGPHQRDVREIYYLCLAMGFAGQYVHQGDEYLLDQLKLSNLKFLTGTQKGGKSSLENMEIFPEAYLAHDPSHTVKSAPKRRRFSFTTVMGILFPILLYGGLFVIFRFVLGNIGDNLLQTAPK